MKQLNREHQAIADQKSAFALFRPAVQDEQSIDLLRFYDAFDGAVSGFVLSELHMRQADRCKALHVFPELQTHALAQGQELNLRALAHLANAQAFLWKFRKSLSPQSPVEKPFIERLGEFRQEIREAVCQLEIKASDASELSQAVDEVCAIFRSGATEVEVFDAIDATIRSLDALRKTPGRGADTNIAAWKILVGRVLLILSAWVTYKCFHVTGRCAQTEKAVHGAVLAIASVVFLA
jgi:hypothetical protein